MFFCQLRLEIKSGVELPTINPPTLDTKETPSMSFGNPDPGRHLLQRVVIGRLRMAREDREREKNRERERGIERERERERERKRERERERGRERERERKREREREREREKEGEKE
jgi:hypothetical protein